MNFFDEEPDSPDRAPSTNGAAFDESFSYRTSPSHSAHASTSNLNLNPRNTSTASNARASSALGTSRRGFSPSLDDILADGVDDDDEFGELLREGERESNVKKLLRHLNNEIGAPELLRFPRGLVERVTKDVARRKEAFEDQNALVGQKEGHYVKWALIATENMRAGHVLKSYLRQRLYKVEKYARYYLQDEMMEDTRERMYHNEVAHARGYLDLCDTYFRTAVMDSMPEKVRALDDPNMIPSPDLSAAVFIRVRKDCGKVVTPDGTILDLEKGTQHMMRYSTIKRFLEEDRVELI